MFPLEHCPTRAGWERQPQHRWPSRAPSRRHGVRVPAGMWIGTKAGEREKQLRKGHFRHFPHRALGSLQRKKVHIKDKKGSIMLPGPPVRSRLAQRWEDCALLPIWLAGSLSHLPYSSLFPGLPSASCLQISMPTSCRHLSPLPK